ncbi:thiamine phosphate synthase [Corynebacterium riegelii]
MNPRNLDLRCYFVTGQGPDVVERAVEAAHGGAGVIQVRSKPISARELYALSSAIAAQLPSESILLIDDRVDIALALQSQGVHGVHLGQDDLDPREARRLLGPDAVIGLTTGTCDLVKAANELEGVIDYIGCGPFRDTPTKDSGRKPIGLEGYLALVEASRLPMVAIGDVTVDDAYALARTGVDGVAIVRGIMHADNPRAYCQRVVTEFDRGRAALA